MYKKILFIVLQYLTPQHSLSRLLGLLAEISFSPFKNRLIRWFIKKYQVNMDEAIEQSPANYRNFNSFFTRPLKQDARPICTDPLAITSPADGVISQLGPIENQRIFQAKGHNFTLTELLGGKQELAKLFSNGQFATIYLSPKDYHRVHMPLQGELQHMVHIPGDLFSVNQSTAESVPRLFARNERVVCIFNSDIGPIALVLVGAMIVASIETIWAGLVTPIKKQVRHFTYATPQTTILEKGAEMGRFRLGSTVILLLPKGASAWNQALNPGDTVTMGSQIGLVRQS